MRFRLLLHAHAAALALGLDDAAYLAIVDRLDRALIDVDGRSFRTTPLVQSPGLAAALDLDSEVWVKDETHNVSGSHKARHLFGVLLHLELVRAAGLEPSPAPPLAIASCGNAALAAAVLARAADRRLLVMVPPDAHPHVLARLRALGADVQLHPRAPGELGDPTVAAFRRAVAAGALPFACQGTDCGLTLDGGKTLGFELAESGLPFDRAFLQIGGGALASSFARAMSDAAALGAPMREPASTQPRASTRAPASTQLRAPTAEPRASRQPRAPTHAPASTLPRAPRLMAIQTAAVAPLARAYARLVAAVRTRLPTASLPLAIGDPLADRLRAPDVVDVAHAVLTDMSRDRATWLPPWDAPQPSAAHGILDDETYDALAILRAMLTTGGSPVVVDEATVLEAETLGRQATGIDADATGTAGLAGLLTWSRQSAAPRGERICLLFTGVRR